MITYDDFLKIDQEVKSGVIQALDYLKQKSMNYILFLAKGEYKFQYEYSHLNLNPYMIDSREEGWKDKDRSAFYINFMETFYTFNNKKPTNDDHNRIHMELMIYAHIWESKHFLRQLYRLTLLIEGQTYPWEVKIPDMGKHNLIREGIRTPLRKRQLKLGSIISKGFHTSLRNAFAHSEYYFNEPTKKIILETYSGKPWDIADLTFNDWSKRFAYSVLLSYHLNNEIYIKRQSVIDDFNTDEFVIIHPITKSRFRAIYIKYEHTFDAFRFVY
ncbi:hypothetical protein KXQ82_14610 [Mucilaginibacter sp. HMF5004]|uniref:hypothetical protein n=1 Tax=Mucilaginibacter rivuli TaxID=2857527 RepID=UPI001C601448|nr:hypothetical protein [Mucilaginibacter rivuli]MBW4890956.1 hypothetical protein [Mucilaginibacter rivuli]